jgi:hypothetical protein
MATVTLPRMGFKTPALEDSRVNLAREAESKLGYKVLARALVASLDNESYYIDVWDEKEYEASI